MHDVHITRIVHFGADVNLAAPPSHVGRRSRKRERTANHLAMTAFELFEAHGFEMVTMEQIADAADVAKRTLYNYFPVKEALLAHQFRQEIAAGMEALRSDIEHETSFAGRMRLLMKASAQWNRSRRVYLPYYLRFRMGEAGTWVQRSAAEKHSSGSALILEKLFRAGQASGEVRHDLSAGELAVMFEFMCVAAVTTWLHQPKVSLEKRFAVALDVLLDGISPSDRP